MVKYQTTQLKDRLEFKVSPRDFVNFVLLASVSSKKFSLSNVSEFLAEREQQTYNSSKLYAVVNERLGIHHHARLKSRLRLITARHCVEHDFESNVAKDLVYYLYGIDTENVSYHLKLRSLKDLNWNDVFINGVLPDGSRKKFSRPKGPTKFTYDEACGFIGVSVWFQHYKSLKTTKNTIVGLDVDSAFRAAEDYWESIQDELIPIAVELSNAGSPWQQNPNYTCDFEEFKKILLGLYNDIPSKTWLYEQLSVNGAVKSRTFSHNDLILIIQAIAHSAKLRRRFKPKIDDISTINNLMFVKQLREAV